MDGHQHYAEGERWLVSAEDALAGNDVNAANSSSLIAQAHFAAAIAASHLGYDRFLREPLPSTPSPAYQGADPEGRS
jgi:hypothetical protein